MWFKTLVLKEVNNKKYNLEVLIWGEDEEFVKEALMVNWFILINIDLFKWQIHTFWATKLLVKWIKWNKTNIILKDLSLKDSYILMSLFWLEVIDINYTDDSKTLSTNELTPLIEQRNTLLSKHKEVQNKNKNTQQSQTNTQHSKQLSTLINIWFEHIKDFNSILQQLEKNIDARIFKEAKDTVEYLQKLLLWSNEEKIREYLQKIVIMKDNIIENNLSHIDQSKLQHVTPNSLITNIDITQEIVKYNKAAEIEEISWSQTGSDTYYSSFGKLWIYLRLLQKDILNKLKDINLLAYQIYNWLIITIILYLSVISIYYVITYLLKWDFYHLYFHTVLSLWILWTTLFIGSKFINPNNWKKTLLIFIISILVYIPVYIFIRSYYAL